MELFTNSLQEATWFHGLSTSSSVPGLGYNYGTSAKLPESQDDKAIEVKVAQVDQNYINHYHIELLQGNNFDQKLNNQGKIIINESAMDGFGFLTANGDGWKYH